MKNTIPNRDLRQRDIVPPERLKECDCTVIGVGAIGRQVALQLAAMGTSRMTLIDPDTVESVNLGCQGYFEEDLESPKVDATAAQCLRLNSGLELDVVCSRFKRSMEVGNVVFCCVDSIETRRHIWNAVQRYAEFFADGRMAAEVLRVLAVSDPETREHYPTTLFAAGQAYQGSCTAKSTIFCANVAAGLMLSQFSRWLRGMPVDADLCINLMASEMFSPKDASPSG